MRTPTLLRSLAGVLSALALMLAVAGCAESQTDAAAGGEPPPQAPTAIDPAAGDDTMIEGLRPVSVSTANVTFNSSRGAHSAFLARPLLEHPAPGLVLIHEWWGLNDGIRREAELWARMGYVTLAVDLYGGKVATEAAEAKALKEAADDAAAVDTMKAAVGYLASLPETDDQPIGSMGWCFGGRKSLQLAIADSRIRACVVYYGQPVTDPNELQRIQGSLLGIFGDQDGSIPLSDVEKLRDGLALAGVPGKVIVYPGVGHAFANPSNVSGYNSDAAEKARRETRAFLFDQLGSGLMGL